MRICLLFYIICQSLASLLFSTIKALGFFSFYLILARRTGSSLASAMRALIDWGDTLLLYILIFFSSVEVNLKGKVAVITTLNGVSIHSSEK